MNSKITRILIVRNNPRNLGESNLNKLERKFLRNFDGHDFEMRWEDLYRDKNFPEITVEWLDYLLSYDKQSFPKNFKQMYNEKKRIADNFAWADKILIVSPYWTGLFPSKLKDWMDLLPLENVTVFTSNDGLSQSGKDFGKEVVFLQTSGDKSSRNKTRNVGKLLVEDVMKYYGVNKFKHIIEEASYLKIYSGKKSLQELNEIASLWIKENGE